MLATTFTWIAVVAFGLAGVVRVAEGRGPDGVALLLLAAANAILITRAGS